MKVIPELVAPAGVPDALRAAVENGAGAVYLGGKDFGARRFAGNFSSQELEEAVNYAHSKGKHVLVTVNTLVKDREFSRLRTFLDLLRDLRADAVIVQDLGVLKILMEEYPELRVHGSTQMAVNNLAGVRFLEGMGVKRIVLARELSLSDIKSISAEAESEIEVFVHGALCYSYSGNCYYTSMLGVRSANRGRCAQACRRPYTLLDESGEKVDGEGYLLSMKDLCALELLPDLVDAGVAALKIEGRMKRPEYVAATVGVYRRALDIIAKDEFEVKSVDGSILEQVFNRGFTKGYLSGELMGMVDPSAPDNQGVAVGRIKTVKKNDIVIEFMKKVQKGDGLKLPHIRGSIGKNLERGAEPGEELTITLKDAQAFKRGVTVYRTYDSRLMEALKDSYEKT